jgi:lysine biosynthesis protein LysW
MKAECPVCGALVELAEELCWQLIECPECGTELKCITRATDSNEAPPR